MIQIKELYWATVCSGKKMSKEEQILLAGDIENWLLTKKSIVCEVKVE